jgi:putative heme-binding domain-containing protein
MGWVPHVDPSVIEGLTHGSAEHDQLLAHLRTPGRLELFAEVALEGRGAVMELRSDEAMKALGTGLSPIQGKGDGEREVVLGVHPGRETEQVNVGVATQAGKLPGLSLVHYSADNPTPRPFGLNEFGVEHFPRTRQSVVTTATPSALVAGGDWAAGKALFFGEAKCGTCHTVRGEGGSVGPNLSNLVQIDAESVLKDIAEPSARINPDHINYIVTTDSGDVVSGLVRQEGEEVVVTEAVDKVTRLKRGAVKEIRPSKISLMPEGYKELGKEKLRDLLTFLTVEQGKGK